MASYYQSLLAAISQSSSASAFEPQIVISGGDSSTGKGTLIFIPTASRTPITVGDLSPEYGAPQSGLVIQPKQSVIRSPSKAGDLFFSSDTGANFRWRRFSSRYGITQGRPLTPGGTANSTVGGVIDGNGYLWVNDNNTIAGGLLRLDPQNPDNYDIINIDYYGGYLLYDSIRRKIFIIGNNNVKRVDIDTLLVDGTSSTTMDCKVMVYASVRDKYYMLPYSGTQLGELDPDTMVLTKKGNTVNKNFASGAYDPINDEIWGGAVFANALSVIGPDTGNQIGSVVLGDRPSGMIYEPELSGEFGTVGKRIWVVDEGSVGSPYTSNVHVIEPISRIVEAVIPFPINNYRTKSGPVDMVYRTQEYIAPERPITLDDLETGQGGISLIGGMWTAGSHNDISGGYIDRFVDISGNNNHLDVVGTDANRALHVESDPIFGGASSAIFSAANSCHYKSSSYLDSIIGTGAGNYPGDMFTWAVIYSLPSVPAEDGSGDINVSSSGLFGGMNGSNEGAGIFLSCCSRRLLPSGRR